ncbi:baculoviral IAP repeat-containing protein 2-like [Liolophura sinensis]|uniref:baculoviral IAP repeat-containing protein 2-like n=1 Tax=Liolophura sinensis TaxID=3198878 RepID=UPI00315858D3
MDSLGKFYARSGARYSHYADRRARVNSFVGWPRDRGQRPQELANAGLFYTGNEDCTRCFYCGGGLRNWLPGDRPFVEHARWFADCQYIRSVKGDDFVNNVNINFPRHYQQTDGPSEEPQVAQNTTPVPDLHELVDKVIKQPCGEALLVLGYPPKLVRAAITNLLNASGWDETQITSEKLARITLEMEDAIGEFREVEPEKSHTVAFGEGKSTAVMDKPSPKSSSFNSPVLPERAREKAANGMHELLVENQRLKEQMKCKVCMDRDVTIALLPCSHLVTCDQCCVDLTYCPLCHQTIAARVKTYI